MDCIYLTNEQIAALYALTFDTDDGIQPNVGVQLTGNAAALTPVSLVAVRKRDGVDDNDHAVLHADGSNGGWER